MTRLIFAVLALFIVQTLLAPSIRYLLAGPGTGARLRIALGPRDEQPPLSPVGARAERALANMYEALLVFLTVALLHVVARTPGGLATTGASVFLAARVLYVPAYLVGVTGLRSLLWVCGHAGLAAMAIALIAGERAV